MVALFWADTQVRPYEIFNLLKAARAAFSVLLRSAGVWAVERKAASNWDGGR